LPHAEPSQTPLANKVSNGSAAGYGWAIAAAVVGVQTGAAIVATRAVVHELGPASLAFLRYAVGAAVLLPLAWKWGLLPTWRRLPTRSRVVVAGLGVLQFGGNTALFNVGLQQLPAGTGALLYTAFPVLAMVLATLMGRERFSRRVLCGVLLSMVGVAVALGVPPVPAPGSEVSGALWVLAAAAIGAACAVLYQPYLRNYAALPVGFVAMLASVLALAAPAVFEGVAHSAQQLGSGAWAAVVFSGCSSGLGYALWLWALARAPASRVTAFLALSPVTALLLGAWCLGEPLDWHAALGTACVVAGLWLSSRVRDLPQA
jgi:drug/metabolite transporter (DMT)-like permease